jgi:hypothetical protein
MEERKVFDRQSNFETKMAAYAFATWRHKHILDANSLILSKKTAAYAFSRRRHNHIFDATPTRKALGTVPVFKFHIKSISESLKNR